MAYDVKHGKLKSRKIYAHELVLKTATGMAEEIFEVIMSDNTAYREFKDECERSGFSRDEIRAKFVEMMIPGLLQPARATLATMLADPANAYCHDQIADALIKDWPLHVGRTRDNRRKRLTVHEDDSITETRH